DLRGSATGPRREGTELLHEHGVLLARLAREPREMGAGVSRAARRAPAQEPSPEHTEERSADAELAKHREDLVLRRTSRERVLHLNVRDGMRRVRPANRLRSHLRQTHVPNVTSLDELPDRADRVL